MMDFESALEPALGEDMELTTAFSSNGTDTVYFVHPTIRIILAILMFLMGVVGIIGNVFVILAVMLSRRLQTAMNAFVVNLAVADLLASMTYFTQMVYLLPYWLPIPLWICVTTSIINITSLGCSIFTIMLIGINRYILITKLKHTYQRIYTPLNMAIMIACAWLIAPICMILASRKICGIYLVEHNAPFLSWIVPIILLASLITVLTCYILIFLHIKEHVARSMTSQSSSKRLDISITKNLLCVVCAFYLCVLPYTLVLIVAHFYYDPRTFINVTTTFSVILNMNSVVNPIIYALRHPIFKPVFGHMIKCRWSHIPEPSNIVRAVVKPSSHGNSLDKSRSISGKTEDTDCV